MASVRMLITFQAEDKQWLLEYSRAHGISMAEAVRRGIDSLKRSERGNLYTSILERTAGIWRKGDGLKDQKKIRAEWNEA